MLSMTSAIAALIVAWALQGLGTYRQVRHYAAAFGEATRAWSDGFVGTGRARSHIGATSVLLLVVDPDRIVRRLMVMRGLTVFARFARLADVEGMPLSSVGAHAALRAADRAALKIAADQIDRAARRAQDIQAAA